MTRERKTVDLVAEAYTERRGRCAWCGRDDVAVNGVDRCLSCFLVDLQQRDPDPEVMCLLIDLGFDPEAN